MIISNLRKYPQKYAFKSIAHSQHVIIVFIRTFVILRHKEREFSRSLGPFLPPHTTPRLGAYINLVTDRIHIVLVVLLLSHCDSRRLAVDRFRNKSGERTRSQFSSGGLVRPCSLQFQYLFDSSWTRARSHLARQYPSIFGLDITVPRRFVIDRFINTKLKQLKQSNCGK